MLDNKSGPVTLELITKIMNELASEIGAMPDDPKQARFLKELFDLTQLSRFFRVEGDNLIGQCINELTREMGTLNPDNSRRAQVVQGIMRLSGLLKEP